MQNGVSRLKFEKLSVSGICWFLLQIFFKTSKKKKKKKQTKRISRFEWQSGFLVQKAKKQKINKSFPKTHILNVFKEIPSQVTKSLLKLIKNNDKFPINSIDFLDYCLNYWISKILSVL